MSLRLAAVLLLGPLACVLRPYDPQTSATVATDTSAGTTADTGTSMSAPTSTSTTSTSSIATSAPATTGTSCNFLDCGASPDLPEGYCDIWTDDCPEGQKCMPVSLDGGSAWESARCVPVVPNPDHVGEPCTILGDGFDGLDTCGRREMCWSVEWGIKMGTCLAMCNGSPRMPFCDPPKTVCNIAADGVLLLCFPDCDPLLQDCQEQELCIPDSQNPAHFDCITDDSGPEGQALDPCDSPFACDPGQLCLDPALAVECDPMAAGCCLPFCDLTLPNTCPGNGQECLPYQDPPVPGYETLGLCGLPMP